MERFLQKESHLSTPALNSSTSSVDPEWASLPLPAVFVVLDKLPELIDHVRFIGVCKEWGSVARDYHSAQRRHKNRALPMLLIPRRDSGVELYCVSQGKVYGLDMIIQLSMSDDKQHWHGCGYGWFAIAGCKRLEGSLSETTITLINPFSKAKQVPSIISLPSFIHDNYIPKISAPVKVFLSDDPALNPDNYVVVALLPNVFKVAFKKGGESNWIILDNFNYRSTFTDAIFYKDQVYLAGVDKLALFNPESEPKFITKGERILPRPETGRAYLVESVNGDLWYVARLCRDIAQQDGRRIYMTESFKVYKLMSAVDGSSMEAMELKSIGDEALFLGGNQSVSILSSQFPGCQPNSIYYTDDYQHFFNCRMDNLNLRQRPLPTPCDMGVFSVEDGTITRHYTEDPRAYELPTPVWVTPAFNGL